MDKTSINLDIKDKQTQNTITITLSVGDKYKDGSGRVWKCLGVDCGHTLFDQDIIINYHWTVPHSQRGVPGYIMTYERTKMVLECPIHNWVKLEEEHIPPVINL